MQVTTTLPYVSVALPVFNGAHYLHEALDALLAQTYTDFELIIGDNGSTDATPAICRAYAERDQRVRYLRSETNQGAAWNYNRLFAAARGRYFRWAAHDDLVAPAYLERCVAVLEAHREVVLCYPQTMLIDEHGAPIAPYDDRFHLRQPRPYQRFFAYHRTAMRLMNAVFGLIRSDTLRETRLIGNYHSADRILLAELALRGQFYEVPERLFFRREHPAMSVRAHRSAAARARWFDPHNHGRGHLTPRWRLLREYLYTIARAPLPANERARCYGRMALWVLSPRNAAWMGIEATRLAAWSLYDLLAARRTSRNQLGRNSA